jgi:hypothetical protein
MAFMGGGVKADDMTVGVQRLLVVVLLAGLALSPPLGQAGAGPFDLMRGWSGGPWDYQYPWAGYGYPSCGFGTPYTWDQPLGIGQGGPYIWGAPFATPSLYLPEGPAHPTPEAESQPSPAADPQPAPDPPGDVPPPQ